MEINKRAGIQFDQKLKSIYMYKVEPLNKKPIQNISYLNEFASNNNVHRNQHIQTSNYTTTLSNQNFDRIYCETLSGCRTPQQKYKKDESDYFVKLKQHERKPLTPNVSTSHQKFIRERLNVKKEEDRQKLKTGNTQYKKLYNKLNVLQNNIANMKTMLEKKKDQRRNFIQNEQKQRMKLKNNENRGIEQQIVKISKQNENINGLKGLVTQVPMHKQLHTFKFNPYSPKHNNYYVSQIVRAYKQQNSLARQHIISSVQILKILQSSKMLSNEQICRKMLNLKKRRGYENKKTIIFDLDETLIHCNENTDVPSDVYLQIKFPTGELIEAGINIRPYSIQLLQALSKKYEIMVFTASHQCYANAVINYLDPNNQYIHHRLFRDHCYASPEGMYIKDLRIINRPFTDMVLVDNAAYSYAYQIQNGIPIIPYYQGKQDYQLKVLQPFLANLFLSKDVREVIKKTFKIDQYVKYDSVQSLVQQLYSDEFR